MTPRCRAAAGCRGASTPSFSESSLTVTPSVKNTGPVGRRLAELEQLARVVRPGLLGGAADGGLGDGARARRPRASSPVFSISGSEMSEYVSSLYVPDELAQVDLVGDRDLRARAALAGGRLLLIFLVVLLALDRAPRSGPAGAVRPTGAPGTRGSAQRTRSRAARSGAVDRGTRRPGPHRRRPAAGPIGRFPEAGPIGRVPEAGPMGRTIGPPAGRGAPAGHRRDAAEPRGAAAERSCGAGPEAAPAWAPRPRARARTARRPCARARPPRPWRRGASAALFLGERGVRRRRGGRRRSPRRRGEAADGGSTAGSGSASALAGGRLLDDLDAVQRALLRPRGAGLGVADDQLLGRVRACPAGSRGRWTRPARPAAT